VQEPVRPTKIDPELRRKARALRRESTFPERLLWSVLRNRALSGLKFRRQQVIGPFIVDFYCDELHLAVEVDGESHVGRGEADDRRTAELASRGVRVIRFTNDDVMHDREAVAMVIQREAERIRGGRPSSEDPHPQPLSHPRKGERGADP